MNKCLSIVLRETVSDPCYIPQVIEGHFAGVHNMFNMFTWESKITPIFLALLEASM